MASKLLSILLFVIVAVNAVKLQRMNTGKQNGVKQRTQKGKQAEHDDLLDKKETETVAQSLPVTKHDDFLDNKKEIETGLIGQIKSKTKSVAQSLHKVCPVTMGEACFVVYGYGLTYLLAYMGSRGML